MAYKKKTWTFKNAIEVQEYHTARFGAPGIERAKKKKVTPEQVEKINQYNRERRARHKLRTHFKVNDYFTTLTYRRDMRPEDMAQAVKQFGTFIRKVRREYKKAGCELKYIRNIEVGTKNGWHIHLIVNRIPDTDIILREAWKHGKVVSELLYEKGEFRQLAAYITKTPKTDKKLREANYAASKNLPVQEPDVKPYFRWKTWKDIKVPGGYYLDRDSIHEGINKAGYEFRSYTLLRYRRE